MKVTIKDVAKSTGVSIATVSRVINGTGYVSDEVKVRVLESMKRLNYQPNAVARSLKQSKTHTIGVIIPDISNAYFMQIAKGVEDEIQGNSYNLIFCSSNENPDKECELLQLLIEKRVDAILLATTGGCEETIMSIRQSNIPIILIDRTVTIPGVHFDFIGEDNFLESYELTKKLIEKGHQKLGVINGPLRVSTAIDRYNGFLQAIKEAGLTEEHIFVYYGDYTKKGGIEAAKYFLSLDEKPSVILSFNNKMASGLLEQLISCGDAAVKNISVATYGEVEGAQFLRNKDILTLIQQPYEIGRRTGVVLLRRLKDETGEVTELVKPILHQ